MSVLAVPEVQEVTSDRLLELVHEYLPEPDDELILSAYELAAEAHADQKRSSGELYVTHPLEVAIILAQLRMDAATVAGALLHDVVEDTPVTVEEIEERFGAEVAQLVDGVTKLSRLESKSPVEHQADNLRKMFLAMGKDIRVTLIKLADRLHNMRTLEYLRSDKQRRIAQETVEIYAPLAHRLGISRVQWELEDLALKHLQPEVYEELRQLVPRRRQERTEYTKAFMDRLRKELAEMDIEATVEGRTKHFYSIYRKMDDQDKDISDIYDLIAVRVIVENVKDCYAVLGSVHNLWRPIPGRFKDYIAMPKANMYQSLHTTVMAPHGDPVEVQIRTWEMHRTAEYGIAAHWRYKDGSTGSSDRVDRQLSGWLENVLDWQYNLKDPREFMESLKIEVFSDEVFVFTPKGDVIELPAAACPVDFAYRIHTEVGHQCVGAKVNGRIVPLDHELQNGDIVKVITSKQSRGPSSDWLTMVKTSTARNKIRSWFKQQRRDENIDRGREMLEQASRREGYDPDELLKDTWLAEFVQEHHFKTLDDVYLSIGYGSTGPGQVLSHLIERLEQEKAAPGEALKALEQEGRTRPAAAPDEAIRVEGIDQVLVRFSKCCNPVPGDPIVGYVTRGRGVSIHHEDCKNFQSYLDQEERILNVSWEHVQATYYPVELEIHGLDRPGLLSDVARAVADTRVNITKAEARTNFNDGRAVIDMVLKIRDLEQLEHLRGQIEAVQDVFSVHRRDQRDHS